MKPDREKSMNLMIKLSLLLNIVVLIPVCIGLITNAGWAQESYGAATAGRSILLSIYISIALASMVFLFSRDVTPVATLLIIQIVYKLTTPVTVGTLQNPVVISNLIIAAFHAVTLVMIWSFTPEWKQEARGSDFGRRYGWTIEVDGKPVGQLAYVRWNVDSQFWHEYRMQLESNEWEALRSDADAWAAPRVALRNKRFHDVVITEFLVSPRPDGIVMVRLASVPVDRFRPS